MKYTATFNWPYTKPMSTGPFASAIEHRHKITLDIEAHSKRQAQRRAYEQLEGAYYAVLLGEAKLEGSARPEPEYLTNPLNSPRLELHIVSELEIIAHASSSARRLPTWGLT